MPARAESSVRPAAAGDAAAIARVQAAVWARVYADVLPAAELEVAGGAAAVATWEQAIDLPPTPRHRVLVALGGDEVVGFAALGPAEDPDLTEVAAAEIFALCVDPAREGAGHGSRLVNAAADVMRGLGVRYLHVWLSSHESTLRRFLESAGWEHDGARRRLDLRGDGAVVVDQERLAAAIAPPG